MDGKAIYLPVLVMMALTFAVWLRMFVVRVAQIKRDRIRPQALATSGQIATLLTDSQAADNFRNLFELPVLFYAAVLIAAQAGQVGLATLTFAWLFVALRIVHSAIHCTYNKVMHRFRAYFAGGVALWVLCAVVACNLLRG